MTGNSDRLLVQTIRAGGPQASQAWDELVERYDGRLAAYIRRRLRDAALVDDTVQETFIGFLNSLANYDDRRELQTWLFTIASHKVTDQLRKSGRKPMNTGNDANDDQLAQSVDQKQRAASSIARNQEQIELEVSAVSRALRELIEGFRTKGDYTRIQVLELLFVKGWANKQVAAHLSVTEQQVANYRFAAVKKLSEAMRAAGLPDDVFPELRTQPDASSAAQ
jgi:RNA polymerase sigma-70 factor (ECF subfamily)